jgi:hypothetical protein
MSSQELTVYAHPSVAAMMARERERVRALNTSVGMGAPAVTVPPAPTPRPHRSFKAYGVARQMWDNRAPRVILAGPAETGKTMVTLNLLDRAAWDNPGMSGVIVRKVHADMASTVLRTWEDKVIFMEDGRAPGGIRKHGGEQALFYQYPNKSRIWVAGLDRPGKVLSSEQDMIVTNQTEELEEEDWGTLTTRTTGRRGVMKPARLIGDANPGSSTHWIRALAATGALELLNSRHEDNPTLFDQETGEITEQGKVSLEALDMLPGVLYKRLRLGEWAAAEGVVYEEFDKVKHTIDAPLAPLERTVVGVDWGLRNPGVMQVWGFDHDLRAYRREEVYQSGKLVAASTPEDAWWVQEGLRIQATYNPEAFVCDPSEPAYIIALRNAGINAVPAFNPVEPGIQNVQSRLKFQKDGRARLYLLRGTRQHPPDPVLLKAHKPTCLEEEMEVYARPKVKPGAEEKEAPVAKNNHACDTARYTMAYVDELSEDEVSEFMFA